jgi:hypothetical protein
MKNMSNEITQKEILFMQNAIGEEKYLKRQEAFIHWLNRFSILAKEQKVIDGNFFFRVENKCEETGILINYLYWNLFKQYIKEHLKTISVNDRINHYKIAAASEFIVMMHFPFVDKQGKGINLVNAKFASFIALQFLFNWNLDKDLDSKTIKALSDENDTVTMDFFEEHEQWLCYHGKDNNCVIFSNMQTMRLLHYWFSQPKNIAIDFGSSLATESGF